MLYIKYYQGDIVNQKLLIFFILTVFIVGTTLGPVSAMICKDGKKSNVELPRLCRSRGFLDLFFCATCLFGVF